jgi:hypothetical protein
MKKNRLLRNENESSLSQYTLVPIFRDPLKKKRLLKSVRKRVRARVKRKSAVTFVTALFFLVAGTRISSISFRMNVKGGGVLTMKSSDHLVIFLFTFPFAFESELSTLLEMKKASRIRLAFLSRQEHRIIEPDMGGVANNHLTK